MSEDKETKHSRVSLRRLFGEYRYERGLTTLTLLIAVGTLLAELMPAYFTRDALNYLGDWLKFHSGIPVVIWPFAAAILLMAAVQNLLRFSQTVARADLGTRITNRLREKMYSAIQRHSLTYHKKTTTGDLIARSTRDIQSMTRFIGFGVFGTADLFIFMGGAVAILMWINPVFALITLCPVPIAMFLTVRFGTRSRGMWKEASESYAKATAVLQENIAYGRPDADFEAVQAAARAARAHEFIMALDQGYDTAIGERGVTLSGGQAQRIAIARAVLLDPKVLIMDDATASVDSETERLIRETMRGVSEGRTNFVIAHRVSSVAHADQIIVLEDGRIAERGTHSELAELGGIYRRMCDQQFGGAEAGFATDKHG